MTRRALTVLAVVIAIGPVTAGAEPRTQLTPFLGLRFGGGVESVSDGSDFDLDPAVSFGLIFDGLIVAF